MNRYAVQGATNVRYLAFVSVAEHDECSTVDFMDFIVQMKHLYNGHVSVSNDQPITDQEEFTKFISENKHRYVRFVPIWDQLKNES